MILTLVLVLPTLRSRSRGPFDLPPVEAYDDAGAGRRVLDRIGDAVTSQGVLPSVADPAFGGPFGQPPDPGPRRPWPTPATPALLVRAAEAAGISARQAASPPVPSTRGPRSPVQAEAARSTRRWPATSGGQQAALRLEVKATGAALHRHSGWSGARRVLADADLTGRRHRAGQRGPRPARRACCWTAAVSIPIRRPGWRVAQRGHGRHAPLLRRGAGADERARERTSNGRWPSAARPVIKPVHRGGADDRRHRPRPAARPGGAHRRRPAPSSPPTPPPTPSAGTSSLAGSVLLETLGSRGRRRRARSSATAGRRGT